MEHRRKTWREITKKHLNMFQGWKKLCYKCGEFNFNAMVFLTPQCDDFKAIETLSGAPVILWVKHHGTMKSLAH